MHLVLDVLLLGGHRLGAPLRVLDVFLRAIGLAARQLIVGLPQLVERLLRLRAAVTRAVGRRAPHRVRRLLQLAREIAQILARHVARQLFETPRRLFDFGGELALALSAARRVLAGRRHPPLTLGLLLLALRELLQLVGELVDLLLALLLAGALLHLVLVRQLVELQLEEIGEVVGLLRAAAAAAAAALLLGELHLVLLLGRLQELQRGLLGRHRRFRILLAQRRFGGPHLGRRLRQQVGDLLEALVLIDLTALHLLDELVDLRLQLALREREEHHVLAVLVRRELRLCREPR